jgi:hypothetical protein
MQQVMARCLQRLLAMDRNVDTLNRMEKLQKKMAPDVIEELQAMGAAELKARIVLSQANLSENEREQDADDELARLKDELKNAAEPYRDAKKLQSQIATYCTLLLEQKGAL